jgi:GntR family transcriptional regulator
VASYYPARLAGNTALGENRKIKGGAVRVLADLGQAPAAVTETITARLPDQQEIELLDITPTDPLIILTRVSTSAAGQPVGSRWIRCHPCF